jgi:hypothetical protein
MTTKRGGRPTADQLRARCVATAGSGKRCGSPAIEGADVCRHHLVGKAEKRKVANVSDRLIKLTNLALDRLESIILTGGDDVAERAARTILARTVPAPGAQHALVVNVGQSVAAPGVPGVGPAEMIRRRLLQLASSATETQQDSSPFQDLVQGDGTQGDDGDVIDAELVEDPEPPIVSPAAQTIRLVSVEDGDGRA